MSETPEERAEREARERADAEARAQQQERRVFDRDAHGAEGED